MKLHTQIPFHKQAPECLIDYNSNLLLLGSCFAEHIGGKLQYHKLKATTNPFGILFHPLAINKLIFRAINEYRFSGKDVFYHNEQWHSFDAHSRLSSSKMEQLIEKLNEQRELTGEQLKHSTHLIITLGTAWVYEFMESNEIVANCHKVPQSKFSKRLLSVEEILQSLGETVGILRKINPDCKLIFTVSPVRHLKDGFTENTRSKSHLINAVHIFLENNENCFYFPSYELMMDELRDYRFYAEDMIHPNTMAINHIWEKFIEVWLSNDAISFSKRVYAVQKSIEHKPFNLESKAHQEFLVKLEEEKKALVEFYPHIKF